MMPSPQRRRRASPRRPWAGQQQPSATRPLPTVRPRHPDPSRRQQIASRRRPQPHGSSRCSCSLRRGRITQTSPHHQWGIRPRPLRSRRRQQRPHHQAPLISLAQPKTLSRMTKRSARLTRRTTTVRGPRAGRSLHRSRRAPRHNPSSPSGRPMRRRPQQVTDRHPPARSGRSATRRRLRPSGAGGPCEDRRRPRAIRRRCRDVSTYHETSASPRRSTRYDSQPRPTPSASQPSRAMTFQATGCLLHRRPRCSG